MILTGIGVLFCVCCLTVSVVGQNDVNVAMNKAYSQISKHGEQGPSSDAANGNTNGTYPKDNNCIHTLPGVPANQNHWWQVDLGRTYPVLDITVWARTGFNNRVLPSTITVDNQTCANVPTAPSPSGREHSVTCSSVMYGRVVRLTYTGAPTNLNLCEFQIFVPSVVSQCPAGHYGAQCGQTCSDNCGGGLGKNFCFQDTGVCYDGCTGNFAGDMCTECDQGYYKQGKGCRECSSDCINGQCNKDTGKCNGCNQGKWGDQCDKDCSSPTARCTQCRQDGACTACSGHFLHPACTDCANGYYQLGGGCQQCSSGCKNSQCDRVTGECKACPDGYHGNVCTMPCSLGCARCDKQSGNCTACDTNTNLVFPGCTECEDGYYKQTTRLCIQCPETCDNNTLCDKTNGHCDDCPPGKNGDTCNQACDGGQYGPSRCSLSCGQCEDGQQCHPVTGHCPRCQPGFYPPLCVDACPDGLYGALCNVSCSPGCARCDQQSGNCTACTSNSNLALPGCTEKPSNQNDSLVVPVVSSVIAAGVIIAIAVVGSVCWYRRSRRGPATKRDTRSTVEEPVNALGDNGTESLGRQPSSSPSPQDDAAYYEISDTANTHEMREVQNTYDALHPYSNDDADRQPYSQIKSYSSDVTKTSANAAYVNTAFQNVRGTNNM